MAAAILDWSQCPALETCRGESMARGYFVTPVARFAVFQKRKVGATVDETSEWFDISKDQIIEVLEFGYCVD